MKKFKAILLTTSLLSGMASANDADNERSALKSLERANTVLAEITSPSTQMKENHNFPYEHSMASAIIAKLAKMENKGFTTAEVDGFRITRTDNKDLFDSTTYYDYRLESTGSLYSVQYSLAYLGTVKKEWLTIIHLNKRHRNNTTEFQVSQSPKRIT